MEGLSLWFIVVNTSQISITVNLGSTSLLVHIGSIEIFLLGNSLILFFLACRDVLETLVFLFATTLSVEIGTFFLLPQYFNTWVTSVQVFWHLPLVTNGELLFSSVMALAILIPLQFTRSKKLTREKVQNQKAQLTLKHEP